MKMEFGGVDYEDYKAAANGHADVVENSKSTNCIHVDVSNMDGLSDSVHLSVPRCPQASVFQDFIERRAASEMELQFQFDQLEQSCQEVCSGIDVNTLRLVDLLHKQVVASTSPLGDRSAADLPLSHDSLLQDSKQYFLHDQKCIYSIRELWTWIHKITHCIQTHITNASEYHQFFHDAKVCEDGLQTLVLVLQRSVEKSVIRPKSLVQLQKVIKEVTGTLLSIEELIENLLIRSEHISPIRERVSLSGPRPGRVLLEYTGDSEVPVKFNDEVTVLEVCTDSRWKVRDARGRETSVPGFIVQLKGVDQQVLAGAKMLQELLDTNWLETVRLLRDEFLRSLLCLLPPFASQATLMHLVEPDRAKHIRVLQDLREFFSVAQPTQPANAVSAPRLSETLRPEDLISLLDTIAEGLQQSSNEHQQPRIDTRQFIEACKLMRTCLNLLKDLEFYHKHFGQLLKRQQPKRHAVASSSLFIAKDDRRDGSGGGSGATGPGGGSGAGGGSGSAGGSSSGTGEKFVSRAYIAKVPPGRKANAEGGSNFDSTDAEFRSELRTPLSDIIFIQERHIPLAVQTPTRATSAVTISVSPSAPAPRTESKAVILQTLNESSVKAALATLVSIDGVGTFSVRDAIQSEKLSIGQLQFRVSAGDTVDLGSNNERLQALFDQQMQLVQIVFRIIDEFSIIKWLSRHNADELISMENRKQLPAELCFFVDRETGRVESLAKAKCSVRQVQNLDRQIAKDIYLRRCQVSLCMPLVRDNTLIEFPADPKPITHLLMAALDTGLITRQSLVDVDLFDATVSPQFTVLYVDFEAMHVLRLIIASRSAMIALEETESKYKVLMMSSNVNVPQLLPALEALADEADVISGTLIHEIDGAEKEITRMNRENRIDDRVNDIYKSQYHILEKETRSFKSKYKALIGEIRAQIGALRSVTEGSEDQDPLDVLLAATERELDSLRASLRKCAVECDQRSLPWSKAPVTEDDVRSVVNRFNDLQAEAQSLKEKTDERSFEKWTQVEELLSSPLAVFCNSGVASLCGVYEKSHLIVDTLNSASSSLDLHALVSDVRSAIVSIKDGAKICKTEPPHNAGAAGRLAAEDIALVASIRRLFDRAVTFNLRYLEEELHRAEACVTSRDQYNALTREAAAALTDTSTSTRLPQLVAKADAFASTLRQNRVESSVVAIGNQQRVLLDSADRIAANLRLAQAIVSELDAYIGDLDALCKVAQKEASQPAPTSTDSCIKLLETAVTRKRSVDEKLHAVHRAALRLKEVSKEAEGLDLGPAIASCERRVVACNAMSVKNALHQAACRALTRKVEQAFAHVVDLPVESAVASCINDLLFSDVTQIIENFEKVVPELAARQAKLTASFGSLKPLLERAELTRSEFASRDLETNVNDLRSIMQRLESEIANTEKETGCIEVALPLLREFKNKRWRLQSDLDMLEVEVAALRDDFQAITEENTTESLRANLKQVRSMQNLLLDLQPDLASLCGIASDLSSLGISQPSTEFTAFLQRFSHEETYLKDKIQQLEEQMAKRCTEFSAQLENAIEQVEQLETLSAKTTVGTVCVEQPEKLADQLAEARDRAAQLTACKAKLAKLSLQCNSVCSSETSETSASPVAADPSAKEHLAALSNKVTEMQAEIAREIVQLEHARKLSERVSSIESEIDALVNRVRKDSETEERALVDTSLSEFDHRRVTVQNLIDELDRAMASISEQSKATLDDAKSQSDPRAPLDHCGLEAKLRSVQEKLENESEQLRDLLATIDEAAAVSSAIRDRLGLLRTWLPEAEQRILACTSWSSEAPTVAAVNEQLSKLQLEKSALLEKDSDFGALQNDFQQLVRTFDERRVASSLKDARTERSPSADSGYCAATVSGLVEIQTEFNALKKKWDELVGLAETTETQWQADILRLGKLEESADLLLQTLRLMESEIAQISTEKDDFPILEKSLKQIESVQRRLSALEPNIRRLATAIEQMKLDEADASKYGAIVARKRKVDEQFAKVQEAASFKFNTLTDVLFYFRRFLQKVDELIWYVSNFGRSGSGVHSSGAESSKVLGATPKIGRKLYEKFMLGYDEFSKKSAEIESVLRDAPLFLSKCEREEDAAGRPHGKVMAKLRRLEERHALLRAKLQSRRQLLESQLKEVIEFHAAMQEFQSWIALGESKLKEQYIFRLPYSSGQQLEEHRLLLDELVERSALMDHLSLRGTALKYQGSFEEGIQIDNLVTECRLRFKKLKCRAEERGRILQQASQETKRFHDWCSTFTNWVDGHLQTLLSFVLSSNRLRQERDELKKITTELHSRAPAYTNTTKQAKVYLDLAKGYDTEYVGLQEVLANVQKKYGQLKQTLKEQRIKIDQQLLASGDDLVALESLLEWCEQILPFLEEQKTQVFGELDCVETLIDQQRSLKSDFDYFAITVQTLKSRNAEHKGDNAFARAAKILLDKWEQIESQMTQRDAQLQRALVAGQDFKRLHDDLMNWIASAENDLQNYWLLTTGMFDDSSKYNSVTVGYSKFSEDIARQDANLQELLKVTTLIQENCHFASRKPISTRVASVKSHFDQLRRKVAALSEKLKQAEYLRTNRAEHVKLLLSRLQKFESDFADLQRSIDSLWDDCATRLDFDAVSSLVSQNNQLMVELSRQTREFDTLAALLRNDIRNKLSEKHDESVDSELPSITHVLAELQQTWNRIWNVAQQQRKQLEVLHRHHDEMEATNKTFDFEAWRTRFLVHVSEKKQRVTDIFRRQDTREIGRITKAQFVQGVQLTGFKTTKAELTLVFDLIARGLPDVDYDRFFAGLRKLRGSGSLNASLNASVLSLPVTTSPSTAQSPHGFSPTAVSPSVAINVSGSSPRRPIDTDILHQEVLTEVRKCRCAKRFTVERVDAGQYKFGTEKKTILLRLSANNSVVVRIGGGWCSLRDYVAQHDPCRAGGASLSFVAKSTPKSSLSLSKSKEVLSAPGTPRNGTSQLQIECSTPRKVEDELLLRVVQPNLVNNAKHLRSRSAHATQLGE